MTTKEQRDCLFRVWRQ